MEEVNAGTYYVRMEAGESGSNQYLLRYGVKPVNSTASGQPVITGMVQVGETLSVDTSGISDGNGLSNVQYAYQWLRSVSGTDTDITDATGSTYTLTGDDLAHSIKVRVSFTNDDGYAEELTSAATGTVNRPPKAISTGLAAITGTVQVGETLSVDTSGISDGNGLSNVQYAYQWLHSVLGTDTDIADATGSTFTLTDDDLAHSIKLRVSFTDDDGYAEELTSAATGTVNRPPKAISTGLAADTRAHPQTVGTLVSNTGQTDAFSSDYQHSQGFTTGANIAGYGLTSVTLQFAGASGRNIKVRILSTDSDVKPDSEKHTLTNPTSLAANADNTFTAAANASLDPGTTYAVVVTDAAGTGGPVSINAKWTISNNEDSGSASGWSIANQSYIRQIATATWASNVSPLKIKVTGTVKPGTPAAGKPVITGPPQVGKTLTADTSGITDADGLTTVDYIYRWLQDDGDTETDVGTDSATYDPVAADVAKTIKVEVTFDDDAGNHELLTSDGSYAVMPAAVSSCDSDTVWCATLTSGQVYDAVDDVIDAVGFDADDDFGSVSIAAFTHGGIDYTVTSLRVVGLNDVGLETTPHLPSSGAGLTLHLQTVGSEVDLPLSDAELNASNNWFFDHGALATTTDGDTVSDVSLLRIYNRIHVLPAHTDVGTEVAVRLSAAANTDATGKPAVTGTPQAGQALTASKGTIADTHGTTKADNGDAGYAYTYQWVQVDTDSSEANITGETSETYTPVTGDVGKKVKVKVWFKDDGGNDEGPLTSDIIPSTGSILAEQEDCATDRSGSAWCATLSAGLEVTTLSSSIVYVYGYISLDIGELDPSAFTHRGVDYTVTRTFGTRNESLDGMTVNSDALTLKVSSVALPDGMVLNVGGDTFTVDSDSETTTPGEEEWDLQAAGVSFNWIEGQRVTVSLKVPNTPATGKPVITGTAQVGKMLTANALTVMDVDGTMKADNGDAGYAYTYQWVQVDTDSTEADIPGETSETYTQVTGDVGKEVKVKVWFKDDVGNDEGPLASDAYPAESTVVAAKGACPADSDWCTTLTVGLHDSTSFDLYGYSHTAQIGALDDYDFEQGGATYTVAYLYIQDYDTGTDLVRVNIGGLLPRGSIFNLGGTEFTADATSEDTDSYEWNRPSGFSWNPGQEATVSVKFANTAATGQPAVTGTAEVGQTLTATKGTIADTQGTTKADNGDADYAYTYQWVLVDTDSSEADITGATSPTYTPVTGDVGKKVKVKVWFQDDGDNDEGPRVSDAYPGTGSIVAGSNNPPVFDDGTSTIRSFTETVGSATEGVTRSIGSAVAATDDDGDTLEYSLEGTDASEFTVVSTSGQLGTKAGERYDHEADSSYAVRVKVVDGNGGTDTINVTINVTDVDEAPLAPAAPTVSPTTGSTTSLDVSWGAPDDTGRPTTASYDLRHKKTTDATWTTGPQGVSRTSRSIGSLDANTEYQVQVRATNSEGDSGWSATGAGRTNAVGQRTLSIAPASAAEGSPVTVTVTLSQTSTSNVTVNYSTTIASDDTATVNANAPGGADFTSVSNQTLTIGAGSTTATFSIITANDAADEHDETFTVTLSVLSGATVSGSGSVKATINDNDAQPFVEFGSTVVTEGAGVTADLTVSLSAESGKTVMLDWTTATPSPNGAVAGQDYTAASGTLTFDPGDTREGLSVSILDDDRGESDEYIDIQFSNAVNVSIPPPVLFSTGDITIVDDGDNDQPQEGVDYVPDDTSTASEISVGESWINMNPVKGRIEHKYDEDWYRTELTKGYCYQIEIRGKSDAELGHPVADDLTLHDPYLNGVYRDDGVYLPGTSNDDGGVDNSARHTPSGSTRREPTIWPSPTAPTTAAGPSTSPCSTWARTPRPAPRSTSTTSPTNRVSTTDCKRRRDGDIADVMFSPLLCGQWTGSRPGHRRFGVRLDISGVYHQPLEIRVIHHRLQPSGPHAPVPPAAEAAVGVLPVSVVRGQIAPEPAPYLIRGSAGAQNPAHSVDKPPVVIGRLASLALFTGRMRPQPLPNGIGHIVAPVRWRHTPHLPHSPRFQQFTAL